MPIIPSASIIRGRILDAARDHLPLEHEDADALVALLDRLIAMEAAGDERQAAPSAIRWTAEHEQQAGKLRAALQRPAVAPFIVRISASDPAAPKLFRALAKALKPKKPSRKG